MFNILYRTEHEKFIESLMNKDLHPDVINFNKNAKWLISNGFVKDKNSELFFKDGLYITNILITTLTRKQLKDYVKNADL